ncbi:hypothetical protein GQ457_18G008470 [Hibiscus cannabinus]
MAAAKAAAVVLRLKVWRFEEFYSRTEIIYESEACNIFQCFLDPAFFERDLLHARPMHEMIRIIRRMR